MSRQNDSENDLTKKVHKISPRAWVTFSPFQKVWGVSTWGANGRLLRLVQDQPTKIDALKAAHKKLLELQAGGDL